MISDRIVVGVKDAKLREKMQLEPDLTLEKAVRTVSESENVKGQQSAVRTDQESSIASVEAIRSSKQKKNHKNNKKPQ